MRELLNKFREVSMLQNYYTMPWLISWMMKTRLIKIVYRRMQPNMLSFTKDISKITRMIGGPKKIYKKNSSKTQYFVSNTITHSIRS